MGEACRSAQNTKWSVPIWPTISRALAWSAIATAERLRTASVPAVWLADAESDDDLEGIVAIGRALPGRVLWCGSGGLAGILARRRPSEISLPIAASLLVICGSNHAVADRAVQTADRHRRGACGVVRARRGGSDRPMRFSAVCTPADGPHSSPRFRLLTRHVRVSCDRSHARAGSPEARPAGRDVRDGRRDAACLLRGAWRRIADRARLATRPAFRSPTFEGGPWDGTDRHFEIRRLRRRRNTVEPDPRRTPDPRRNRRTISQDTRITRH